MDIDQILSQEIIKVLLPFISAIFAVVFGAYQFSITKHRNKIKLDLEILKLFGEVNHQDSSDYLKLESIIKERVFKTYRPNEERTDLDRSDLSWGFLAIILSGLLIFYVNEYPTNSKVLHYCSIFVLSLLGFFGVYKGFERKFRYWRKKKDI